MSDLPLRLLWQAFWFVAANLFTLFRLCWFPIAVLIAAQAVLGQGLATLAGGTSDAVLEASPFSTPSYWLSAVLQTIALSVAAVRVHRFVLFDDRRPGEYFLFAFGKTEASYVAMVASLIGAAFAASAVMTVGISILHKSTLEALNLPLEDPISRTLFVAFLGAGVFIVLWFVIRLSLWPVVVVANEALAPAEAWLATRQYAVPMFFLFFLSQLLVLVLFSLGAILGGLPSKLVERHSQFGGWVNPSILPFAQEPTPQLIAFDFGLTFLITVYMATLLSLAYLEIKRQRAFVNA